MEKVRFVLLLLLLSVSRLALVFVCRDNALGCVHVHAGTRLLQFRTYDTACHFSFAVSLVHMRWLVRDRRSFLMLCALVILRVCFLSHYSRILVLLFSTLLFVVEASVFIAL